MYASGRWLICAILGGCCSLAGCGGVAGVPAALAVPPPDGTRPGVAQTSPTLTEPSPSSAASAAPANDDSSDQEIIPFTTLVNRMRGIDFEPLELVHFQDVQPVQRIRLAEALSDQKHVLVLGIFGAKVLVIGTGQEVASIDFRPPGKFPLIITRNQEVHLSTPPNQDRLICWELYRKDGSTSMGPRLIIRQLPSLAETVATDAKPYSRFGNWIAISPDGTEIASHCTNDRVVMLDASTLEVKRETLECPNGARNGCYIGPQRMLIGAQVWDTTTNKMVETIEQLEVAPVVSCSPDLQRLLLGTAGGLKVFDLGQRTLLGEHHGNLTTNLPGKYSSDGKLIAVLTMRGLAILDAITGQCLQLIGDPASARRATALSWIPQTRLLLIVDESGALRVWGRPEEADRLDLPRLLPNVRTHRPEEWTAAEIASLIEVKLVPSPPEREHRGGVSVEWVDSFDTKLSLEQLQDYYSQMMPKLGWQQIALPEGIANSPPFAEMMFARHGFRLGVHLSAAQPEARSVGLEFGVKLDPKAFPWPPLPQEQAEPSIPLMLPKSYKTTRLAAECAVIRTLTQAGWVQFTRTEYDWELQFLKGHRLLKVLLGESDTTKNRCVITYWPDFTYAAFPTPADVKSMEWDDHNKTRELTAVLDTELSLQATQAFYLQELAARGWRTRTLPKSEEPGPLELAFYRDQDDLWLELSETGNGRTRVDARSTRRVRPRSSSPIPQPAAPPAHPKLEAADLPIISPIGPVAYAQYKNHVEYLVDAKPIAEITTQVTQALARKGWRVHQESTTDPTQHHVEFRNQDGAIFYYAYTLGTTDGHVTFNSANFAWSKRLPVPPVPPPYLYWVRDKQLVANDANLDRFLQEMEAIEKTRPAAQSGR